MPYERPGERYYPTAATKAVDHGMPVVEEGIHGVALKQQPAVFGSGLGGSPDPSKRIAVAEKFVIDTEGIVEVPNTGISGAAKGALVYIADADNSLSLTSGAGKRRYGTVHELAGERKTPTGRLRIKLSPSGQVVAVA
jgi:hypothetical protein